MRALILGILLAPAPALACGYCVEDKVAAVYDHAAISSALKAKQTVVFFSIDGALHPADARKIESLIASTRGIEKGSVRLAIEAATMAVAFDPKHVNLGQLQNALERRLAPLGLSLLPIRLMERPGDLAAVPRR